jgi:hypothetical protein
MPGSDAENLRVMVRVYANLSGLAKSLASAEPVGTETGPLIASFASSFTHSQPLCDFIDVGNIEAGAALKIKGKRSSHSQPVVGFG